MIWENWGRVLGSVETNLNCAQHLGFRRLRMIPVFFPVIPNLSTHVLHSWFPNKREPLQSTWPTLEATRCFRPQSSLLRTELNSSSLTQTKIRVSPLRVSLQEFFERVWPSSSSTTDVHYFLSFFFLLPFFALTPIFLLPFYPTRYRPWYYTYLLKMVSEIET